MATTPEPILRNPAPSRAPAAPAVAPPAFTLAAAGMVVTGAGLLAWLAWDYYVDTPWTRDGTVRAYTAQVAPEVSGRVTAVAVSDDQAVQRGDVLFRIDDQDYRIAVRRAQAALDRAKAALTDSRAEAERRERLSDLAVSAEVRQTYESQAAAALAAYEGAQADLDKANLDLERTTVRSPVNGFVTNRLLQAGTYAVSGTAAMTLIDSDTYWVAGYFEETQLRRIRIGDGATVALMGFPDLPLAGRVEGIGRGITDPNAAPGVAGLPAVNPVFTWVRLAQRIPVRIRIAAVPGSLHLAAGMTATVRVRPATPSPGSAPR